MGKGEAAAAAPRPRIGEHVELAVARSQLVEGPVDPGVVRIELGAQYLVPALPLIQLIILCLSACHKNSLLF